MRARIQWKRAEEGGRVKPPAGVGSPPYATVARFLDSDEAWPPENAWSLVIERIEEASAEYEWLAEVRYLVADAPHEELRPEREFELYEGGKCVAIGRILAG